MGTYALMTKKTTILNKKQKHIGDLNDGQKFQILWMYTRNEGYKKIAERFNLNTDRVTRWVTDFLAAAERQKELNFLTRGVPSNAKYEAPITASKALTDNFLSLLSDENDMMLNEAEHIYVQSWVQYGNSGKALTDAKLDVGLTEIGVKANKQMRQARGQYLRRRKKIKEAIAKEEVLMLEEMASSKEFLQKTLIQTIRELQEDTIENGSNKNNLLKSIELLGKTIPGSFTETVRTEEVSPKDTLTLLMKKVNESSIEDESILKEKVTYHAE